MAFMDNMDNNDFVYILEERDFNGMCIIMVSRDYYKLETLAEKLSKQQSKYEDCDYVIVGAYLDKEYEALDEPEIVFEYKSNGKRIKKDKLTGKCCKNCKYYNSSHSQCEIDASMVSNDYCCDKFENKYLWDFESGVYNCKKYNIEGGK